MVPTYLEAHEAFEVLISGLMTAFIVPSLALFIWITPIMSRASCPVISSSSGPLTLQVEGKPIA